MPDQSHPPYAAGSKTIPRTLIRWLDINAQNGSLRRIQTFITLPSFVQATSTWNGYSDIVASFNCEAPNNFSLTGLISEVPASPNYTLCISYRVGGVVTRYILWEATGTVSVGYPMYNGQPIKKNFRFEVWNTSQGAASQSLAINLYTSVKGGQDYRYSGDVALKVVDAENDNFFIGGTVAVNAPPTAGMVGWFNGANPNGGGIAPSYGSITSWRSYVNIFDELTATGTPTYVHDTSSGLDVVDLTTGSFASVVATGINTLFNAAYVDGSVIIVIMKSLSTTSAAPVLSVVDSSVATIASVTLAAKLDTVNVNGLGNTTSPVPDQDYFMVYLHSAGVGALSPVNQYFNTMVPMGTFYPNTPTNTAMLTWTLAQSPVRIAEILVYTGVSSQADFEQLLNYLTTKYKIGSNFLLPLTFPATSVSTTN
jgi:hypothetical protein